MSAFPFVPRTLSKPVRPQKITYSRQPPTAHDARASDEIAGDSNASSTFRLSDKDMDILVSLALSDYAMWSDPHLFRKMDPVNEGFVPLRRLLRKSTVLVDLRDSQESELSILKAVKRKGTDVFEARIILSSPGEAPGRPRDIPNMGGYQVRGKNWRIWSEDQPETYSKEYWDDRTAYVENIPPTYRTFVGVVHLLSSFLSRDSHPPPQIQNILFPPHHQDKPGDRPRCKGFAVVTFSEVGEVERLIRDWPWDPLPYAGRGTDGPFEGAVKCGFRTLTKRRWDQLQEEYLLYRQRLLEEITTTFEGNEAAVVTEVGASGGPALEHPTPSNLPTSDTTFPPYPLSCLVLVQNIHSETNKTTLRALLSRALSGTAYTAGLDYIDYRKGTDSCYIRVATAAHGKLLSDYFSTRSVVQEHGLDDAGAPPRSGDTRKAITVEVLKGRKEQIYWEKVPQQILSQALRRAQHCDVQDNRLNRKPEKRKRIK